MKFGIDISKWNGNLNLSLAKKNHNIEFVIIKAGGADDGYYTDRKFQNFYNQCEENNIPKGCYFYGNAKTETDALNEAMFFINIIAGKRFELPVFYDVEGEMLNNDKRTLTEIIKTFCDALRTYGFLPGVYMSQSHFNEKVFDEELNYIHWVACWSKDYPIIKSGRYCDFWQYGGETNLIEDNKINGITTDKNYMFSDFTEYIKRYNLNGYIRKKTVEELAREVIRGSWGNGAERKKRLTEAGYNYAEIQTRVNELLS